MIKSSLFAVPKWTLAALIAGNLTMGCASHPNSSTISEDSTTTDMPAAMSEPTPAPSEPIVHSAAPTGGTAVEGPTIDYTVRSGDSLWKIAHDHQTTVKKIRELNSLGESANVIRPGMKLKVIDNRPHAGA